MAPRPNKRGAGSELKEFAIVHDSKPDYDDKQEPIVSSQDSSKQTSKVHVKEEKPLKRPIEVIMGEK